MANPLKELDLKPLGFQIISEIHISAAPAKVWAAVTNPSAWWQFNPQAPVQPKQTLELKPGGRWFIEHPSGNQLLHAVVTHIETNLLLRFNGPFGMQHLPVSNAIIFELQSKNDGKETLLRVGQRTFGFIDAELEMRYRTFVWPRMLPQIKELAEK